MTLQTLATSAVTPDATPSELTTQDPATEVESLSGAVDTAVTEVQELLAGFAASLPRLLIAAIVFGGFWLVARLVGRLLQPRLVDIQDESTARVVTSLVRGVILTFGVLVFLAVAFPGVNVATLLGAGGVVALAAGFAFQDLAENALSGLLLLLRQPFQEGDVIEVDGNVGIVQAVTIRETRIRRFDRQVLIVPNSQVYKNAIRIQTENPAIRSSVIVGVGYDDDLQQAEEVAVEALRSIPDVLDDPAPEAFYTELAGSSINLDLRYFHTPGQHDLRRIQGEVVKAIQVAFAEHDIDIPFPITTLDAQGGVADAMRAVAGRDTAADGNGAGSTSGQAGASRRRVVRRSE